MPLTSTADSGWRAGTRRGGRGKSRCLPSIPPSGTPVSVVASDTQAFSGSAAWCATMQICWDEMLDSLCGGRPLVPTGGENATVSALNASEFDAGMVSDDHYYAYAGPKDLAARRTIESAIRERFGQESDLLDSVDWSRPPAGVKALLFYCMLYRKFSFAVPFGVLEDRPWGRTGDQGHARVRVTYFGVDSASRRVEDKMRKQVRPLYYLDDEHHAVSIDTREGDRVVLVRSPEGSTFSDMWEAAQRRTQEVDRWLTRPLGEEDEFRCPNVSINLRKEFDELEGVEFLDADGRQCSIQRALQTIRMTLDNEGGEVKSEAVLAATGCGLPMEPPEVRRFVYDGPFALFLVDGKARRGARPYLALMVDDDAKHLDNPRA